MGEGSIFHNVLKAAPQRIIRDIQISEFGQIGEVLQCSQIAVIDCQDLDIRVVFFDDFPGVGLDFLKTNIINWKLFMIAFFWRVFLRLIIFKEELVELLWVPQAHVFDLKWLILTN